MLTRVLFLNGGYCNQLSYLAGRPSWQIARFYAVFVYLEHPEHGPALIDTGYSPFFFDATRRFPGRLYRWLTPVHLDVREHAPALLKAHGIAPGEVRRVFVSHFHGDHVAGLRHFPQALFPYRAESLASLQRLGKWSQVRHGFLASLVPEDFTARGQAIAERDFVPGTGILSEFNVHDFWADGSLVLVDLPGHAEGHTGYVLRTATESVFYIVDACWDTDVLLKGRALPRLSRGMQHDYTAYVQTQEKLSALPPAVTCTSWHAIAPGRSTMWPNLDIDLVAPPFAGHLFPLLDLARSLRQEGCTRLSVLTTGSGLKAVRLCDVPAVELLPGRDATVMAIANPGHRVGFNPLRLYRQFRMNLGLMAQLRDQLRQRWSARRPALVVADFTIPVAGVLARSMGIPWWTAMPSPCALETRRGTPSYLGGWMPRTDLLGRIRDACGRVLIQAFKRGIGLVFRSELRGLSIPAIYRRDGLEAAYSPECILGFGMREFEFERDWPPAFRFVGPLTGSPPYPHVEPDFPPGRPCILVSLGTHLAWAKEQAALLIREVARQMPDCVFHFSQGEPGSTVRDIVANVHRHGYVPYDLYLPRYSAAVIHGGTGITYSCIKAGVPILVWPQDYDQFDHAARIVGRGLGVRLKPRCAEVVTSLRRLLSDEKIRANCRRFQELSRQYDTHRWVVRALRGDQFGATAE